MMSVGQDIMSTLGVYHDECGDIMSRLGVFSTPGDSHEYTGGCSVHWEVIMSTPGVFSTPEGYHEYTGGIP